MNMVLIRPSAQYMLRAPFSLEKMIYDEKSGVVIYRSKMHASLKRNYQLMPGAQCLELLCRHIPDRYEHLVRTHGWYPSRSRGERRDAAGRRPSVVASAQSVEEARRAANSARVQLTKKVYETDPLICPNCAGPRRGNRADRRSCCHSGYSETPGALGPPPEHARRTRPAGAARQVPGPRDPAADLLPRS